MTDRPRALAVLIAVFLLGCIVGSAGSYMWFRNHRETARRETQNVRFSPGQGRQRMPDLNLTREQEAQFGKILGEMRIRLDGLRKEQQPRYEAIRSEANQKLMSILNEEQKKKFSSFLKETESRRMRGPHGGRGMDGPPPPP